MVRSPESSCWFRWRPCWEEAKTDTWHQGAAIAATRCLLCRVLWTRSSAVLNSPPYLWVGKKAGRKQPYDPFPSYNSISRLPCSCWWKAERSCTHPAGGLSSGTEPLRFPVVEGMLSALLSWEGSQGQGCDCCKGDALHCTLEEAASTWLLQQKPLGEKPDYRFPLKVIGALLIYNSVTAGH